jgi:hypothetical protein
MCIMADSEERKVDVGEPPIRSESEHLTSGLSRRCCPYLIAEDQTLKFVVAREYHGRTGCTGGGDVRPQKNKGDE